MITPLSKVCVCDDHTSVSKGCVCDDHTSVIKGCVCVIGACILLEQSVCVRVCVLRGAGAKSVCDEGCVYPAGAAPGLGWAGLWFRHSSRRELL